MRWRRTALGSVEPLVAAFLSVAICALVYELWRADLRMPLSPVTSDRTTGDYTSMMALAFKGMVDNPWYSKNQYVGAPLGLDLRDFPFPDQLLNLWVKGATLFTRNPFLIANVTLVASFPLVTLPALFVLRRLNVRYSIALVASLLFSFLSYHQMRGLHHVYYVVGYFSVPLVTLVALELFRGEPFLFEEGSSRSPRSPPRLALRSRGSLLAMGVAVVMGLTGTVYFTFFSAFVIGLGGLFGAVRARSRMPLLRAAAILAIAGAAFAVNMAPTVIYVSEHGKTTVLERDPSDAEVFALKITELLLPRTGHRFEPFRRFKETYDKASYDRRTQLSNVTENNTAYLGLVGSAGFLYLTFTLLMGRRGDRAEVGEESRDPALDPSLMDGLRVVCFGALLLGTVGGFGSLVAFSILPEIRSYNRISVYIAFVSLAALAVLVERAARSSTRPKLVARGLPIALGVVLVLGVLDQTQPVTLSYAKLAQDFQEEGRFIAAIEESVPTGSSIFELPYMAFPENGPQNGIGDYGLFVPYLHSKSLRWSYGTMRGRRGDGWYKGVAEQPAAAMVDTLASAGFAGIYVDRDGYVDRGAALEGALTAVLGPPSRVGLKGSASFFPLAARSARLREELGDEVFARRAEEAKLPLFLGWLEGFYLPESANGETWVWCRKRGRFVIDNPSGEPRRALFEASVLTANGPANVRIHGDLFDAEIHAGAGPEPVHFVKPLLVPPGEHFLEMESDGARAELPVEARDLYVELRGAGVRSP
ncbi:MAG: hypothetical protein ACLQVI_29920 [Polyangiaceae bacterium]